MRERHAILSITLFCVLVTLCYHKLSARVFTVRGSIQFYSPHLDQPASAGASPAYNAKELTKAAYSPDVLSAAVLTINQHQFGLLGTSADPVKSLQRQLKVRFDPGFNRLDISIDTAFPHQAATVINTVIESLLKLIRANGRAETGAPLAPLKGAEINLATADVPPEGLPTGMTIGLSVCAGLLFGIAIALYRGIFNERVGDLGRIEKILKLPTVVCFPLLSSQFSPAGRSLAAYIDPMSEAAERCRAVLALMFGGEVSGKSGTVLVTSAARGDGRSTLAVNLATTLAASEATVVLVDADAASPVLHKLLGEPDLSPGLCEALENPSATTKFARPTRVHNLHVLSCGRPSANFPAKLHGTEMEDVLSRLREKYSYILIDSGPLLGQSDTAALASRCQKTLLVMEAQRTLVAEADECRKVLDPYGDKELFAVLNAHHPDGHRNRLGNRPFAAVFQRDASEIYQDIHNYGWYREENTREAQEILSQIADP